ncbi:MAG: 16S rRNA (guanine(527)-N(7))-methyltransferase RsmG [Pseudomonadota bacterium]|nr:16S rRNA (guanine(527)-N(7))-methyltransferase RsmG [Pseudomonadota bacterium]
MDASTDPLPLSLQHTLESLQIVLAEDQKRSLLDYLDLLQRWNSTYNLTAVREPAQMLTHHLADCLAIIGPLQRECGMGAFRLLDVGSGGGLPGAVIAMVLPQVEVTCIDSVGKKAAFIRQVAGELKLRNLRAIHSRVEELETSSFDVIGSRAFASLSDFIRVTRTHLALNGTWMAMKGKVPTVELSELPADVDVFHVEQLRVPALNAERCIVWMRPHPKS